MTKGKSQHRRTVYDKYEGHCAYCGKEIALEEMQIDHIWPKASAAYIGTNHKYSNLWAVGEPTNGINHISNLNPSCRRCNHYKRDNYLEGFRHQLQTLHERIQKQYIDKVAIDYGIITVQPWDGVFYFERIKKNK